jgi:beta-glucosidase
MTLKKSLLAINSLPIFLFLVISSLGFSAFANSNFIWGISTSPYQTEDVGLGNNFKTDWDVFFDQGHIKEPKGDGTFSYSEVDRDIEALVSLGVTHYRFGIEWARVEPALNVYDEKALIHYLNIVRKLKKKGIVPIVCLWHFSFPSWLTHLEQPHLHGWLHPQAPEQWRKFVEKVVQSLGQEVELYAPQNEPNANALAAYFLGIFPPGQKYKLSLYRQTVAASAAAYVEASQIIHRQVPGAKVISIQNLVFWDKAWWDVFGYFWDISQEYNFSHLDQVMANTDWLGFNYYYRLKASPFPNERFVDPSGMEKLIVQLSQRYSKPMIIMENGVADTGDKKRADFLMGHLQALERSRKSGQDVRGYFYWSLIDNFEWSAGYEEKFGLFSIDSKKLKEKPSAGLYRNEIAKQKKALL